MLLFLYNMSKELELKYKVDHLPEILSNPQSISQYYFDPSRITDLINKYFPNVVIETINTFRYRKISYIGNIRNVLTLKTKGLLEREEYETDITEEDAKLILEQPINSVIHKNRFVFLHEGYKFEFDEYLNLKEPLFTCEIELNYGFEQKDKQYIESILRDTFKVSYIDVTLDKRYKNVNLQKYF